MTCLQGIGTAVPEFAWQLLHSGGQRILDRVEEFFLLAPSGASWARNVSQEYGKTSWASVHFVTSEFLKSGIAACRGLVLTLGVGSEKSTQLILFRAQ